MSASKDKGRRLENMVANTLNANGIPAERTPLSGSLAGKYSQHVIIGSRDNILRTIECKNMESWTNRVWEALGTNDYLCIKTNHKPTLVFMSVDTFAKDFIRY